MSVPAGFVRASSRMISTAPGTVMVISIAVTPPLRSAAAHLAEAGRVLHADDGDDLRGQNGFESLFFCHVPLPWPSIPRSSYRRTRPERSPRTSAAMSFSVERLKSPGIECLSAAAATAKSSASPSVLKVASPWMSPAAKASPVPMRSTMERIS